LSLETHTSNGVVNEHRTCFADRYIQYLNETEQRKNPHKLRSLGINVMLSILSVSVFICSSEMLARIQYTPQKISSDGIFEYDHKKVFRLKENQNNTFHGVPFTTNSFGYRDEHIDVKKPENTKRILVVGDSISFGDSVLDHETYPSVLEDMLNSAAKEKGVNIEVINTAAPGNSPFQEYYDLKQGMKFDPDVVVLQFTLNDVIEQYAGWVFTELGEQEVQSNDSKTYEELLLGMRDMSYVEHVLKQNSALYLFLKDMQSRIRFKANSQEAVMAKAQQQEVYTAEKLVKDPQDPEVLKAWENALSWIEQMAELAKKDEIPFIILATPFDFQFSLEQQYAYPQRILQQFAEKHGVEYVDLLSALQQKFAASEKKKVLNKPSTTQVIVATRENEPEKLDSFWRDHFIDYDNPSPKGHAFTANILEPVVLGTLNR